MNEYESYWKNCETGYWAEHSVEECPCRGRGWWLSEVDTWHQCPYHGKGKPHPEDERDTDEASEEPISPITPLVTFTVIEDDDIPF